MATTTDDAFHEIELNRKQLVFLFMAGVVVSVVIFLCGVLVGRGVRAERGPLEAGASPSVTDPTPDAAVAAAPTGAPTAANEELSYPNRLQNSAPTPEKLRAGAPTPSSAPPSSPPPTAPVATASEATSSPSAPAAAAAAGASELNEPAGAGFAIQVAALGKRAEADTVAKGLTSKGYPAYVINPEAGAPAVFRVRVGKFKERRDAESVAARLQKEEQFKPWIVR